MWPSRECAVAQGQVSLGRKSPNQWYSPQRYVFTNCSRWPPYAGAFKHHHLQFSNHPMNICTAFLNIVLEEDICTYPPNRYYCLLQYGSRYSDPRAITLLQMVLHLRKSLSGLKWSSHVWYGMFKDIVIIIGFMAFCVNRDLFMVKDSGTVVTAVFVYVDDLLIIAM